MKASREELLHALAELSEIFPEWRFGQMVANVATAARGPQVEAIWDSEDDEMLAAARRLLERNRGRAQSVASE
jgi:hypothetical protein